MLSTIFASATPAGKSALSVLRIAGPQSFNILCQLAPKKQFIPRQANIAKLYGANKKLLDEALVLYFQAPKSYTGEDIVELYLHGSPVISRAVQSAILETKLARYAEPGEFTRRAFENSRMDLTQVEGIRDLLAAETEMQRQSAIGGAAGQLSQTFEKWRSEIVGANAMLTAAIDFAEDNGLEDEFIRVRHQVEKVRDEVKIALDRSEACSEIVKSGVRVALLGEPNAGKSSLTNHLLQRNACLVSEVPGTTRDVLEVALEVNGHKLIFFDTAGIRESKDTVEKLGIERAHEVIESAHLVIALFPSTSGQDPGVLSEVQRLRDNGKIVIKVISKTDLTPQNIKTNDNKEILSISSKTGEGIDQLTTALTTHIEQLLSKNGPDFASEFANTGQGMSVRARGLLQNEALPGLTQCLYFLNRNDFVLANAELQRASAAIGMITGRGISVHEVLDVVFGEFCIGK